MKKTFFLIIIWSIITGTAFLAWCTKQTIVAQDNIVQQGDTVEISYTAMLPNGLSLPSKKIEDMNGVSFVVWAGKVIKGLDEWVIGMKVNDRKALEISPENAYANEYDPMKVQKIAKALFDDGIVWAKEGAYIKIGDIEGTIKWFTKDENGKEFVLLETNPLYTYTTISYVITLKKLEKGLKE